MIAKILRICLEEIDALVAASIPRQALLNYETQEVLKRNPHLRNSAHLLAKKIRNSIRDDYSVVFDRQDIDPAIACLALEA